MAVTQTVNTTAGSQGNQVAACDIKPSVYANVDEYDDCLEPKSNNGDPLPGPSGLDNSAFCHDSVTSSPSHYQQLQESSYQQIVPKGGSLLPDIKVGDLGRYIQSMLEKENAFDEEFQVINWASYS